MKKSYIFTTTQIWPSGRGWEGHSVRVVFFNIRTTKYSCENIFKIAALTLYGPYNVGLASHFNY